MQIGTFRLVFDGMQAVIFRATSAWRSQSSPFQAVEEPPVLRRSGRPSPLGVRALDRHGHRPTDGVADR